LVVRRYIVFETLIVAFFVERSDDVDYRVIGRVVHTHSPTATLAREFLWDAPAVHRIVRR